jgi:two-component system sensor histidine kinase UhpB
MLFVAILLEERKAVEAELRESQATLKENYIRNQELAGKLLSAQEDERRKIGRDLHDDIGQRLALVSNLLYQLEEGSRAGAEQERHSLKDLHLEVESIAEDVQGISRELHSSTLEHLGLPAALKRLCLNITNQHDVIVQFESFGVDGLPTDFNLCLFRVAQEALNNAIRHGKAGRIGIQLRKKEDRLSMSISDDGKGFDPTATSGGLGLVSMQERVRFLGGTVLIQSEIGKGTQVEAELSIRK